MGRNNKPLRYGKTRGIRLRERDEKELIRIAQRKGVKPTKLIRQILERSLRKRRARTKKKGGEQTSLV